MEYRAEPTSLPCWFLAVGLSRRAAGKWLHCKATEAGQPGIHLYTIACTYRRGAAEDLQDRMATPTSFGPPQEYFLRLPAKFFNNLELRELFNASFERGLFETIQDNHVQCRKHSECIRTWALQA